MESKRRIKEDKRDQKEQAIGKYEKKSERKEEEVDKGSENSKKTTRRLRSPVYKTPSSHKRGTKQLTGPPANLDVLTDNNHRAKRKLCHNAQKFSS